MKLTLSSGVTVTVNPPPRGKAIDVARRLAALGAPDMRDRPSPDVTAQITALLGPFVECTPRAGLDKATYLVAICFTSEDWDRLFAAVLAKAPRARQLRPL